MNKELRKRPVGASTSEFLPILAFVVIAAIVGFTALGQQQRQQGSVLAQQLAGSAQSQAALQPEREQSGTDQAIGYAADVATGFVEGVADNLEATWDMLTNPAETVAQITAFAQQLIDSPGETLAVLAEEFGDQIKEIVRGNGKALGRFLAEHANPNRIATLITKLRRFDGDSKPGIEPCKLASFTAGTPVLTPSGLQPIERLQEGDWVVSRNDQTFSTSRSRITALKQRTAPTYIKLSLHNEQIHTTAEHPFWTQRYGWEAAVIFGVRVKNSTTTPTTY